MTNKLQMPAGPSVRVALLVALSLAALSQSGSATRAADASYPFEGTWVRANRACTATAPLARTYTSREVIGATVHCAVRKVAAGSGQFEIFEECRRGERPGNFTETIRMMGADAMVVRRQVARLKIARPLRYIRCSIAGQSGVKTAAPHRPTAAAEPPARAGEEQVGAKPKEPPQP